MKYLLDLLHGTTEIDLPNEVVQGGIRELDMNERALAAGGMQMVGTTITLTPSSCGGWGYDDSRDGYTSPDN
ncbi:MAG: hypothetical protein KGN16_22660 [Burkholderiales bacterium]|nr:hypothetical protein [Burkholderiales bacterium]